MLKKPVALQTFTVRDEIEKDFKGAVEQIAKIGYKGIEIGGDTGGMDAPQLREFLAGVGIAPVSWHAPLDQLTQNTDEVIDYAQALGMKFVVCPIASGESAGDYYSLAKSLEEAGKQLGQAGIVLGYHNHSHEFKEYDGHRAIDIILANSDPESLTWQVDTYWVKVGGVEPQDYIRKYSGRVPLLHLKDMTPAPEHTFAEVGNGILNWTEIFSAADDAQTEWYIVEQDQCQRPPMESIRISFENLKRMGVA